MGLPHAEKGENPIMKKKVLIIAFGVLFWLTACGNNATVTSGADESTEALESGAIEEASVEMLAGDSKETPSKVSATASVETPDPAQESKPAASTKPDYPVFKVVKSRAETAPTLPAVASMQAGTDINGSFDTYLNDYIYPAYGVAPKKWSRSEIGRAYLLYEDERKEYYYAEPNYLTDVSGVIGSATADFDKDGTPEMMIFGLAKGETGINYEAYRYTPYIVLCSVSGNTISVTDTMFYAPEDPEGYEYGSCNLFSTSDVNYDLKYWLIDNRDSLSVVGHCFKIGNGFGGDISYGSCFELTVSGKKLQMIKHVLQTGGGSDGFTFAVINDADNIRTENEYNEVFPNEITGLIKKNLGEPYLEAMLHCTQSAQDYEAGLAGTAEFYIK